MAQKIPLDLVLCSITKDCFGIIEIEIMLNNKRYTYSISSEYACREFQKLVRMRRPGKALNVLRKFKIEYREERRK